MSDVLIVGGGLSGAAAALGLARAGTAVHLIERHAGPAHKICGEFLSVEAEAHLAALGLDLGALGAVPVSRVRLVSGSAVAETSLPFVARGISRERLDEALLERADTAGVVVERGVRVTRAGEGSLDTDRGERRGRTLMLATGKLSVRQERPGAAAETTGDHVGFKMHWRVPLRHRAHLAGLVELSFFPGGYAGLQMVSADIANLCLVLRRGRLAALGGRWEDVLAALAGASPGIGLLADAEPLFARPVTIARLPYGRIHRASRDENAWRLGDQAAMTASLTGDGMAIALRSAALAVQAHGAGATAQAYHRHLNAVVGAQVRRGMAIQRLAAFPFLSQAGILALRAAPPLLRLLVRATRLPDRDPAFIPHGVRSCA